MTTLAEAVAAEAVRAGVGTAFGLLGEANLELVLALRQAGLAWVALRKEDAVAAAADGFAQGTGGVGLAVVSQGPALVNALNPLISAAKGRIPVVLLTGALADDQRDAPQWCDHAALAAACGVRFIRATTRDAAAEAFRYAAADHRPVVLEVPTACQATEVPAEPVVFPVESQPVPSPSDQELDRAARLLAEASRPVLLAGRGALGARAELVELAERAGALLATTLTVKGLFDGEPYEIGVCGGFATAHADRLLADADVIAAFGAGLNAYTTRQGRLLQGTTLIRVDIDAGVLAGGPPAEVALHGGAAEVATALRDRVPMRGYRSQPGVGVDVGVGVGVGVDPEPYHDESGPAGLDLRTVSRFLDDALPADRALTTDLGYFTSEPAIAIRVRHPRRTAFPLHFGSIGTGLATAVGLAAADPAVPTLCAVGDGGLCASLGELESLARARLPVVVAVFNDSAYGVEVHELRHRGEPTGIAEFPPVDFAAVAAALGLDALSVSRAEELPRAAGAIAGATGPLLIDFRLNPSVVTRWYRENVHP